MHTPGPWIRKGSNVFTAPTEKRVGGFCIAQCNTMMDGNTFNARLIAAAPDLLEALKECIERLDAINDAPEIALAAIAKATE
jgi:hypothetical protein